jgi:UDP-N-acetylglucosamine--N-acetylmuramyl-(pentapeptide) pyrophosphoryl-undecaprenol N-acetylglucosamine transferase
MQNGSKTIIIAAGGTGGHLYPGLALAAELAKRGFEPLFIVRENDACRDILAEHRFPFLEIPVCGMPRKLSGRLFVFAFKLVKAFFATRTLLKKMRPEVIVGMGGYISFPMVAVGRLLGIRTVIHEQNCLPGLSNRVLSRFVDTVAVSAAEALPYFDAKKTVVTGNPVRADLFSADSPAAYGALALSPEKFTVLVFGGSQGAAGINKAAIGAWELLGSIKENIQFLHIAGKRDYDAVRAEYERLKNPGTVLEYLHAIGNAYAVADLIICRAGASTIAELAILNKPSILIPFPYATGNHQEYNAAVLVNAGKAKMIREKELTPELLAGEITAAFKAHSGHAVNVQLPALMPQELLADLVAASRN